MRNQDKGLLTTSTRLLNAQVKKAEMKQEVELEASKSPDTRHLQDTPKQFLSTIDLLRQQKEMVKKKRKLSRGDDTKRADD